MPRAVLVFGVPGLFAVLDLISNAQLWIHQKLEKLPPTPVRATGRWGIAVLGTLLCPFWLLRASGTPVTAAFLSALYSGAAADAARHPLL